MKQPISVFVEYEVRSSWWAPLISNKYLQNLAGRYFAWKVRRKYRKYQISKMWKDHVNKNE